MQGGVKEFIKKMIHSLVLFSLAVCKEILMLVYCTIGLTGAFTVLSERQQFYGRLSDVISGSCAI